MGIKQFVDPSIGPRRVARIITVHPETRKIEAQLKDGGNIQISLFDVPTMFVWPQVDEYWIVRQDGGYWKLNNKFDTNDDQKVIAMNPGEAKIAAEIIKTPSGREITTVSGDDYNWINLKLINGWEDVSTLSTGDAGYEWAKSQSFDEKYLLDLPLASYQYNIFRKTLYLRGMIYNANISNAEFATIYGIPNYNATKTIMGFLGKYFVLKPFNSETMQEGGGDGILAFGDSSSSAAGGSLLNGFSIQIV
jgi:hypothetical protein